MALPVATWAQSAAETLPAVAVPPANVLLPNYGAVPIGEIGGLEVGAFLARANDSSSTYYNPAGLTRAEKTSVSGTAGTYQWGAVAADGLTSAAGSFQQVPAMFGFVLQDVIQSPRLSAGLSIARIMAWEQRVDFQRTRPAGAATDRMSYSGEGRLDSWLTSLGVGIETEGKWRVGLSIDAQYTSANRRQAIADQYLTANALTALLVDARSEANAGHARFTLGTQYDLTPNIIFGAVVRSRGFGVFASGFSMLEGTSSSELGTSTASYFEDAPETEYRVPFELKTGAAYLAGRGEIEIDLLYYDGAGEYAAITPATRVTVITAPGGGRPPVVAEYASRPSVVDSRAVFNVAIGGHFDVTENGAWVAHGGYGTERSPVGPNDTVFTKAHLQKVTAGLSARTSRFLGSLGVQYLWGDSDEVTLRELPGGTLSTRFGISSFGVVYSLAVLF